MNSYLDETRFPGLPGFEYGEVQEIYTGMNDTAVYGFTGVTAEQAAQYRELLLAEGFEKADENTMG